MRNGLVILAALVLGGVVYAASPSASTQPSGGCCGGGMRMSNMKMDGCCGMKCMMGGTTPTTQPAAPAAD